MTLRSATNAGLQEEDEAKLKNRAMEQQQIEYVTDILTGISQEGSWAPPPESRRWEDAWAEAQLGMACVRVDSCTPLVSLRYKGSVDELQES